jgi:hypothetical protein
LLKPALKGRYDRVDKPSSQGKLCRLFGAVRDELGTANPRRRCAVEFNPFSAELSF